MNERLSYTRAGAIEATGLAPQTIDKAIADGELVALRSGRRLIILADELRDWLKRCRAKGIIPTPKPTQDDNARLAEKNRQRKEEAARRKAERDLAPA